MRRSALLVSLFWAILPAVALTAIKAQERAGPQAELNFQRVYAPADRMSDWPTGNGKYLPLESAEFDRLLALSGIVAGAEQGMLDAQIVNAEYRAKLTGEQLLTGQAILQIIHRGQSATMLPLEPCNVSMRQPAWDYQNQDADNEAKKTLLGIGRNGNLQTVVRQSGKLSFDWCLSGHRDANEAMIFYCEFPACPVSALWLDLSENLTPALDKGLVSSVKKADDGRGLWCIELGGNCRFQLRLTPLGSTPARQPLALLRESSVYEFSPRGLDISAQWKIQVHDEPLDKIIVLLDPGVQLATAYLGDSSLPWTIETLPGEAGTRAVLSLPEPLKDTERTVRLGALAPLTVDHLCRLPRLIAEGLFWQEGAVTLIVPDPLIVERLTPIDCGQKAVGPLAEPRVGESLEFQKFSPEASIELSLARRPPAVQLVTGTAVELGTGQMTARILANFRSDDTASFTLEADVSNSWIIDSVETIPPEALTDWSLEGQTGKQNKLTIQLSKAPSSFQNVRFVLNGHRLRTFLTHQWSLSELLPLRFTTPSATRRLALIRAADFYDMKVINSEQLARLNPQNLSADEMELFSAPITGLLFEDNAGAAELQIAIQTRKPTVSGDSPAEPPLTLPATSEKNLPAIWVQNCHLQSWYVDQGGARHQATFYVHNTGGGSIEFVLPPGVSSGDVRGVWVDNKPVDWQAAAKNDASTAADSTGNTFSAPLPKAKQFSTVSIRYTTHESGLRTIGSLSPALPRIKAPLLACTWTVWLPPGFEFVDAKSSLMPGNQAGSEPADTQGWIAQRVELSATQPVLVKYIHIRSCQCWAAMFFILTLALGYWQAVKHPIFFCILTGIFGMSAIILPEAYVPFAYAAVLGMLGCLMLEIIRYYQKNSRRNIISDPSALDQFQLSGSNSARLAGKVGVILIITAASLFFVKYVRGEDVSETPRQTVSSDYRVFVPIDSQKKPVGDKVYLPERFYNELHRRAAAARAEPQGWLLGSAVYRGSLVRESATGRLASEAITAQFDLHVFSPMIQVRIPFRRENCQLIPDSATLDGRPIQAQWEADGSAIKFDVEEPGDYRLELGFRLELRGFGASAGIEMSIPRLAQSRLELMLPGAVPGIEVQSAIGAVNLQTDPPRLLADLGPSNRLAIHWPAGTLISPATSGVEADQLTWMKVQSGSVVVDVRFKFHIRENQVRRLQLATDPQLRLLPLQGKDTPSVQIRTDGAKQQIITLQWNRPLTEEVTLDLSFLLTGASGMGKILLPHIQALDMPTANRWMAVSVDPLLQYESRRISDLEAAAPAEFLKNWGPANSAPLQVYRLVSDKVAWSISTRPREPEISAQQSLALRYDRTNVEAYFDAQLTVASGYVFQYHLSVPGVMRVLKASVQKEGAEQVARWSQDRDGTVTIFLIGPAEGKQELSLHGIIPLEHAEKTPLPNISLQQCRVESTTVEIFRGPDVNIEPAVPDEFKSFSVRNSESDLFEGRGRLVQTLYVEGGNPVQGELLLTDNRLIIDAKQATRLRQQGQQWIARADFLLDITDGQADQFWIDAPKAWTEPYTVDPPAAIKTVEISGDTKQLIVQPKSAVQGKYRFSITGAMEIEPDELAAAPDIVLRRTEGYSRWIVLPRQLKGQPINWETQGLRPAELPDSLATPLDRKENFAYEIVSDEPRAAISAQTVPQGSAKVNLADIHLAWQADGLCYGTAIFDLEPGGQTFCPLNMPDEYELIHVAIDGQPSAPLAIGPSKWKLPLPSKRQPQRIEIVFRGKLSDYLSSGKRVFSTPWLGDMPVTKTFWTVSSPTAFKTATPASSMPADWPWQWLDKPENIARYIMEDPAQSITIDYQYIGQVGHGKAVAAWFFLAGVVICLVAWRHAQRRHIPGNSLSPA